MSKRGLKPGQAPEWKKIESARLAKSIDNRIEYLIELKHCYSRHKKLPDNIFIPKPTLDGLCKWEDKNLEIFSIGSHNTLKKDKKKFEALKELAEQLNNIHANLSTSKSNTQKNRRDTIAYWKNRHREESDKVQTLRDELITLRTLYLDLLSEAESNQQLNKRQQESIRRHRRLYGTLRLVDEIEQEDSE